MSTVHQLNLELTNLISESKRKNSDIKHAAEKSLEALKAYSAKTSETEFVKGLSKNPDFITPFLLACRTRNTKYVAIAISCFQKLIIGKGLPITKLELMLDAFIESTNLAIEIQLKILQCLPFLFQNYSIFISDKILIKLLSICSILQGSNKSSAVNNTASATFLQLIGLVFDKINDEDSLAKETVDKSYVVPIDNDKKINIGPNAYDSQRIFLDLCILIEHHKPHFLKTNYITENFGFELLESVIKSNKDIFLNHVELGFLLRTKVVPLLLRFFSVSKDFPIMVRVARLIFLLIREQFDSLKIESEVMLSLLTHILSKDSSSPFWKKILSLEIYRGILNDFKLVEKIFTQFDNNKNENTKKIIYDFLKTSYNILDENRFLLNTGDIVQPPPSHTSSSSPTSSSSSNRAISPAPNNQLENAPGLSISKSSIKINFIDLLDKPDAPPISETYLFYLILTSITNFCEGICKYALDLSSNSSSTSTSISATLSSVQDNNIQFLDKETSFENNPNLKGNLIFITELIEKNYGLMLPIYKIFIYSTLDNDIFHKLIRSLQKLCHASGILTLTKPRDDIFEIFALITINLVGKVGFEQKTNHTLSFSESIVGTISSTINQALATPGPVSTLNSQQAHNEMYTRNINSRNILCFRVLSSLAISLGTVLQSKWKLIFITLQWLDYYIRGPSDELIKDFPPASRYLTSQDLINIENSINKLDESINFYSNSVFHDMTEALITLSDEVVYSGNDSLFKEPVLKTDGESKIQPCAYNKIYFSNKLMKLCRINPRKFLIENDENWNLIGDFYFKIICNRSLDYEFRLEIGKDFNSTIKYVSIDGFHQDDGFEYDKSQTELKVLNSLYTFIKHLTKLSKPNQLLILNCETEIHLQVLNTLKELLDKYGIFFKNWNLVFKIINSPFEKEDQFLLSNEDDKILVGKVKMVINSSFENLKLILDEFLLSLPSNQLKILIDCLSNFIKQTYDLNISFNSISYFWLISDYLRDAILKNQQEVESSRRDIESYVTDEGTLLKAVSSTEKDENLHRLLWIYLLFVLSKSFNDDRNQVRNGSIQTFFSIVDSHGRFLPNWNLIYDVILKPKLMKKPSATTFSGETSKKEWIESLTLILNGLVKLYCNFLVDFDENSNCVKYWSGLVSYFNDILTLNSIELNIKIYKAFNDVLKPLSAENDKDKKLPNEILELFYNFWSGSPILYNLIQNALYQESLTSLMESFPLLFKLIGPVLNLGKFETILCMFDSCVRYPVLPELFSNDDMRCTQLQESIYQNLSKLVIAEDDEIKDAKYQSLLLQELLLIVILPFSTRMRIEQKLNEKLTVTNLKVPTFTAISYQTLELLKTDLKKNEVNLMLLLKDRCILKVFKSLSEPTKLKAKGVKNKPELWIESSKILTNLAQKCVDILKQDSENQVPEDIKTELWTLIIEAIENNLLYNVENPDYEEIDISNYDELKGILIPNLELKSIPDSLLEEYINTVWSKSFLYPLDEIERAILTTSKSPLEVSEKLSFFEFDNLIVGSTKSLTPLPRLTFNKKNLNDLISFALPTGDSGAKSRLFRVSLPYFVSRSCFVLRKFISDESLLNKCPLPKIQQYEMVIILNGILKIFDLAEGMDERSLKTLDILYPLIIKSISVSNKIDGIILVLEKILMKITKLLKRNYQEKLETAVNQKTLDLKYIQ
ncbi:hypothetical protein PACTADRAFT_598 [Pachysolen tannophilus NRRL Y-2460]|uniref:Protein MON2 homolog n=1 Tax=Pachysolen tannophilus NRRL Y-2460 TaxID=669874 RepID=A0A1E4U275_PACTA|nr:hypothetical protein PACTADRAFT_598 [Pachysolen tannophilus NRRL Y-2460]